MSEPLDLKKFSRIISMIVSPYDNEALNAWRLAAAMLRSAGMTLADFVEAYHREQVATEAATGLVGELAAANAKIAELEAERSAGTAVAIWQDVGAQIPSTREAAKWALGLNQRGLVWLSDKEIDFLNRVTVWVGPLTPRMRPFFQSILDRIVTRTGLVPPT